MKNTFMLLFLAVCTATYSQASIKEEGNWCADGLTLNLHNKSGKTSDVKWYKDDVLLTGENNPTIQCNKYGLGVYKASFKGKADVKEVTYDLKSVAGPVAVINGKNYPAAGMVMYIAEEVPGVNSATSWAWNFGDGTTGVDSFQRVFYKEEGLYDVVLTVTDEAGCSHTSTLKHKWSYN